MSSAVILSSLDRLADVEIQLIMHGLIASSLLQLARCSRRLLHAADSAFAWRFTNAQLSFKFKARSRFASVKSFLRGISSTNPFAASPSHPLRHSLSILQLRSADVRVDAIVESKPSKSPVEAHANRLREMNSRLPPLATAGDLAALSSRLHAHSKYLNVNELDIGIDSFRSYVNAVDDRWLNVLPSAIFHELRVLKIRSISTEQTRMRLYENTMIGLAALPFLHTLSFINTESHSFRLLPTFPSLTSLRIIDNDNDAHDPFAFSYLSQCQHLSQLDLMNPTFSSKRIHDLFGSGESKMQQRQKLKSMNLRFIQYHPNDPTPSAEEYTSAFTSLKYLDTLHVSFIHEPHLLLCSLIHAPSLRSLILHADIGQSNKFIPTVETIKYVLAHTPDYLLVQLHLESDPSDQTRHRKFIKRMKKQFEEILTNEEEENTADQPNDAQMNQNEMDIKAIRRLPQLSSQGGIERFQLVFQLASIVLADE